MSGAGELSEGLRDAAVRGLGEALIGRAIEQPGPGIEELDGLGPRLDLGEQVLDRQVGQLLEQQVDLVGPGLEPLLQDREILRAAPLDQVGREGEGRAGEAEQRNLGLLEGLAQASQDLEDVGHALPRIRQPQRLDLAPLPNRSAR